MEALVPDPQPQETVPGAHRVRSKNEDDGGRGERHCPLLAGNSRIIRSENQLGYTLLGGGGGAWDRAERAEELGAAEVSAGLPSPGDFPRDRGRFWVPCAQVGRLVSEGTPLGEGGQSASGGRLRVAVRSLCDPDSSDEGVGRVSRNLLKRMPHLFEFVRDARIPWHNNAGERAIRSIGVKRKMSGGMRSAVGARTYARLKGVHEMVRRNGEEFRRVVLGALTRAPARQPTRSGSTA